MQTLIKALFVLYCVNVLSSPVTLPMPDIVASMTKRLNEYKAGMVPARNKGTDPRANPANHDGYWVPWVNANEDEAPKA